MLIKCFSFFEIPTFEATVAILLFGGNILKLRARVRPDGSVNLPDGQREEWALPRVLLKQKKNPINKIDI